VGSAPLHGVSGGLRRRGLVPLAVLPRMREEQRPRTCGSWPGKEGPLPRWIHTVSARQDQRVLKGVGDSPTRFALDRRAVRRSGRRGAARRHPRSCIVLWSDDRDRGARDIWLPLSYPGGLARRPRSRTQSEPKADCSTGGPALLTRGVREAIRACVRTDPRCSIAVLRCNTNDARALALRSLAPRRQRLLSTGLCLRCRALDQPETS